MKTRADILHRLVEPGVIAVLRADSSEQLLQVVGALKEGGVTTMEVTMTTPNALEVIKAAIQKFGDEILMGVGTVLDSETCKAALLAGAEFVVTPVFRPEVIKLCRTYGCPVIGGAYTPTEILNAWESGVDFVKVFPADTLGPTYIKGIKGPLPQVELIPTGGVDAKTVGDFIKAGSAAVGAGSSLVSKKDLEAKNWAEITRKAKELVCGVASARKKSS